MKYKAIFFDLDGTLLPCHIPTFTKVYFSELAKLLIPHGYEKESLINAIWTGTKKMVLNDGSRVNRDVFWESFAETASGDVKAAEKICDAFYSYEFHRAKAVCGENPLAAEAVKAARNASETVVLATNPIFPMAGQLSRISWVDLTPDMFDLITAYENSRHCKPNPEYYKDICKSLSLDPSEVLMIGNDEDEDMHAGAAAGLSTYLVTDCLIPSKTTPYNGMKGTFAEMVEYLKAL